MKSLSCGRLFATPVDCSLPGSSVHGILQARILEWVTISSSIGLDVVLTNSDVDFQGWFGGSLEAFSLFSVDSNRLVAFWLTLPGSLMSV